MGKWTICLLVLGLANLLGATEMGPDGAPQSEAKEIEAEMAKGSADFAPSEKTKRGVAKLSNADNPGFNHLSSAGSSLGTASKSGAGIPQTPYRYFYNNQFYPSTPYIPYLQSPHAAQVASQYAFQPSGVAHYLQTPTQIQYVSTPSVAARYQTLATKTSASGQAVASAAASPVAASQYQVAPAHPLYLTMPHLYQTQASTAAAQSSASTASQYHAPQQYYYPQQPIVMLLVQPQPTPLLYAGQQQQQHQMAYVLGQQPLVNLYGGHRFALPYTTPSSQVTYLVPMTVQTSTASHGINAATAANLKAVDKTAAAIQAQSSSGSYGARTTKS